MNILVMESDWADRKHLKYLLKKAAPDAKVWVFSSSTEALEFAKENLIDVAFIDLEGTHMSGCFLAKDILALQKTNIIFTNYEWERLREAFQLRVSGYLRKPLQYEELLMELQNLRYSFPERKITQADEPECQNSAAHIGVRKIADNLISGVNSFFKQ